MKLFQLVMRGGLTRNVEADGYRRERNGKLVFRADDLIVFSENASEVMMVENVHTGARSHEYRKHQARDAGRPPVFGSGS